MAGQRLFPSKTLEQALRVPQALRDKNGGNTWEPAQVAGALGIGAKTANFYYLTAASRDHGFTEGTRDSAEISLTALGRQVVYPQSPDEESNAKLSGFLNVEVYKRVLEHYGGNNLPERQFLDNTLQVKFGIEPALHDEFVELFDKNCRYLGIGSEFDASGARVPPRVTPTIVRASDAAATVTVVAAGEEDAPVCFVIMPFTEREDRHQTGFFFEVLKQIFTPAAQAAGFQVRTAQRQGSDMIQATIVKALLEADLVLADLTEHNPNVLFELGMRMREDRPVALVKAKGTGPIFDVDNMLRVVEYDPNVWPSTVERDVVRVEAHIRGTWENRASGDTFMGILGRQVPASA